MILPQLSQKACRTAHLPKAGSSAGQAAGSIFSLHLRCTWRPDRMSHRKWRESKQQPSRARSGNQLSCCLVSLHFLCDILLGRPVVCWSVGQKAISPLISLKRRARSRMSELRIQFDLPPLHYCELAMVWSKHLCITKFVIVDSVFILDL